MAMSPSSIEGTILAGTDDAESHQSHPLAGLGALLATPQSAALVVTAFLLAATMYILSDRAKANRTEKHWDEVCRQVLRERDEVGHEVLGKAYSGAADDAGDILKVRCWYHVGLSMWGCRFCVYAHWANCPLVTPWRS